MGRLFTYMVKAAAGQQPAPYTGYYGVWDGLYNMGAWETAGHRIRFGGGSSPAYNRYIANRRNYIDRMFAASRSGNSKDWGKLQGAGDYLTALDHDFKDAASIYDILSGDEKYREAIQHLANTGSWAKLKSLAHNGRPSGMRSPFAGDRSDYQLADGVGNAQLIMNMYLAEEARRKAEEAQQPAPQPEAPVTKPAAQPEAPKPATTPVQTPAIPEGTHVVTGPDGKQYISSSAASKAQTAAGIGAALEAGQNPFTGARTTAPGASGPTRVTMDAGQAAVRNHINSNIASGQSMYSNMGDVSKFMTKAQRDAMDAAKNNAAHYEGSGLRMVGHSADGNTQTYVGRSGRGRITVGAKDAKADAAAGHYRGAGVVDTNPRSRYKTTQPRVQSPARPPQVR